MTKIIKSYIKQTLLEEYDFLLELSQKQTHLEQMAMIHDKLMDIAMMVRKLDAEEEI